MNFDRSLVIALSASLVWTILFSMSNSPGLRGFRNLGILAAYVCLIVFLFRGNWRHVVFTWLVFALAGGLLYTSWEAIQRIRTPTGADKPEIGFTHVFPSVALWPIMIPEAVEYALAEFGVLKPKT